MRTCMKLPMTKLYRKTNEEVKNVTKTFLKVRNNFHCSLCVVSYADILGFACNIIFVNCHCIVMLYVCCIMKVLCLFV